MLVKSGRSWEIAEASATPESVVRDRRRFLAGAGGATIAMALPGLLSACTDETVAEAESLLIRVMQGGKRLLESEPLADIQQRFLREFAQLPESYKDLKGNPSYPVTITSRLQTLQDQVSKEIRQKEMGAK